MREISGHITNSPTLNQKIRLNVAKAINDAVFYEDRNPRAFIDNVNALTEKIAEDILTDVVQTLPDLVDLVQKYEITPEHQLEVITDGTDKDVTYLEVMEKYCEDNGFNRAIILTYKNLTKGYNKDGEE